MCRVVTGKDGYFNPTQRCPRLPLAGGWPVGGLVVSEGYVGGQWDGLMASEGYVGGLQLKDYVQYVKENKRQR